MTVPNYLIIGKKGKGKNADREGVNFSKTATQLLDEIYPKRENPYTNIKVKVELFASVSRVNMLVDKPILTEEVFISSTKNVKNEVINTACFVADMWIDDKPEEHDNISVIDLQAAKVTFVDNPELTFIIALDLRSKATEVEK